MTRVSSGGKKSGPPVHANRYAFAHNPGSRLTKIILAMPISGVCPECREVIEWRKRFRKYKPLTVPKRCVRCEEKNIKEAYHVICNPCAAQHQACAKCLQPFSKVVPPNNDNSNEDLSTTTLTNCELELVIDNLECSHLPSDDHEGKDNDDTATDTDTNTADTDANTADTGANINAADTDTNQKTVTNLVDSRERR